MMQTARIIKVEVPNPLDYATAWCIKWLEADGITIMISTKCSSSRPLNLPPQQTFSTGRFVTMYCEIVNSMKTVCAHNYYICLKIGL